LDQKNSQKYKIGNVMGEKHHLAMRGPQRDNEFGKAVTAMRGPHRENGFGKAVIDNVYIFT